jgi:hypothetical protein
MAYPDETATTADGKLGRGFMLQPDILNLKSVYRLEQFLTHFPTHNLDG